MRLRLIVWMRRKVNRRRELLSIVQPVRVLRYVEDTTEDKETCYDRQFEETRPTADKHDGIPER